MTLQLEKYYWIFSPKLWHWLCYYQFQTKFAVISLFILKFFFFPCPKLDILLQNQQNHNQGIIQKFSWKYSWIQALTIVIIFCLQKGLIFMFGLGTEPVLPEVLLPESKQRPQLLLCVRSLCFKIIPCYVVFLNCFVGRGFITLFSYFHAFYSINTSTMIHPSFSANATHCIVKINRVRIRLNMAYSQPHPM